MFGALAAALFLGAVVALGAELVTAEVTGTTNDVTVTQGTSTSSTINLTATGAIACTITSGSPSTATVDTSYSLDSAGALTSSTPSSAFTFYSDGVPQGGPNCGVTWTGAPTAYSVTATFSAAATTPVGSYTITLSDAAGTTAETNPSVTGGKLGDTTATTVTVHVVAPVVTNGPPTVKTAAADANGTEGDLLSTSGAFQDPDGDALSLSADNGAVGSFTDNGNGTWTWSYQTTEPVALGTITVTANDGHGHTVTDAFNYSATNVAPLIAFVSPPSSANEGETKTFNFSITDPGTTETYGFVATYPKCGALASISGTPSITGKSGTFDCSFPDGYSGASSDVTVRVSDGTDNSSELKQSVAINNVAPIADVGNNGPVDEGSPATISFSNQFDPSTADTIAGFHYAFDCSGGDLSSVTYASSGTSDSTNCTFDDNGVYTVSGAIIDKDDGLTQYTTDVTVNNVAPTVDTVSVSNGGGTACLAGNTAGVSFTFHDPGVSDDPWLVDIDWGDGSAHGSDSLGTQAGTFGPYTHTYGAGTFTPKVTITDKDGDPGSKSASAGAVSFLYNMTGILAPFNPDGSSVWKYGSTLPVKVRITDCNGNPVSGLAPKVGTSLVSSTDPNIAIDESQSTSAADTTGIMRYDPTAGQYIYNFGSKYLSDPSATYYMTVKGTDANGNIVTSPGIVQVKFGLKTK